MKLETVDLKLCQIQGKIFEESIGSLNCSSQVFIRRFMLLSLLMIKVTLLKLVV